jgi:hypothetical protein
MIAIRGVSGMTSHYTMFDEPNPLTVYEEIEIEF